MERVTLDLPIYLALQVPTPSLPFPSRGRVWVGVKGKFLYDQDMRRCTHPRSWHVFALEQMKGQSRHLLR